VNHRRWTVSCLVAVCGLALVRCDQPPPKKSSALSSRVELAAGNVMVAEPGGKASQAIAGLLLRQGATVKVGPGDRALLRLDDGSGVFLRHGTEVTLEAQSIKLSAGEVWVEAPPRDKEPAQYVAGEVTIAASDAGLDIKRTPGAVEVYVARGLAVVSGPGGRAEVQSGERAVVQEKRSPALSPVAFWEDWTGGMADRRLAAGVGGTASGRLYAIDRDRPGTPPQELEIRAQSVGATIRDGVARTTVDQRFFNPSTTAVEGYYWFTIPEGAAVDRFALEVNGALVDGEVIERKQAHAAYEASIRQAVDPALLEWIDGRTFRARIFPIPAAGDRRVVLSYIELLPTVDGRTHYVYPMGGASVTIQEFSLEVDLGAEGGKMALATTADARVEEGGRKVSMRRSGYKPQGDFLLEMTSNVPAPLRAMRLESTRGEAAYVMVRYTPDVEWNQVKNISGHVVVVVDTSAGGDDADRQVRTDVAEAILRALSTADRFALMAADLTPRVLYPDEGLAPADEASIGKALERLSSLRPGGATDLGGVLDVALKRLHGATQPAVVYVGDGLPTVGELEGDALAERVTRSMAGSSARLFTVAVGADASHALLGRLARIGGGATFRVDLSEQAVQEALRVVGYLKTPTITNLRLDLGAGLDQVFSSATGKISRGQEVTLLARTHHPLPSAVKVSGEFGGQPFGKTYDLSARTGLEHSYVPTLWARRYLTHLLGADAQKNRGTIIRLGVDYALMTPFTSFLVLDSDAAYGRFGIQRRPRDPLWGLVPRAALEALSAAPLALFGCTSSRDAPSAPSVVEERVAHPVAAGRAQASEVPAQAPSAPATGQPARTPATNEPAVASAPRVGALRPEPERPARRMRGGKLDEVDKSEGSGSLARDEALKQAESQPQLACSDAARRSLAHRRAIWVGQLEVADQAQGWIAVYRRALGQCEMPHWRDRKELLDLIQARITTPADVRTVLAAIGESKAQDFIRRQLLRRAVSPEFASASSADAVDWAVAEAALARVADPSKRVGELRRLCEQNPASLSCALRLVQALLAADRGGEALALSLKLREEGRATPALMQEIGDLLARAGKGDEAMRAYSEIVEFSPRDPAARQLLGDICLRHGWYDLAYRQYKTLSQDRPDDAVASLRLAAAAAGSGRVDEALRLERKVAGGEGEPGPSDPRRWARLHSAARIAQLMVSGAKGSESARQSMERSLRRLQVWGSPSVLFLVTWEDLEVRLELSVSAAGRDVPSTDRVDAAATGLVSASTAPLEGKSATVGVRWRSGPGDRVVRLRVTAIVWDGKRLSMASQEGKLSEASQALSLALPVR
jgi:tetratricopeptide (TPR) repeat protein/Mg-chelatase subunit ChlD